MKDLIEADFGLWIENVLSEREAVKRERDDYARALRNILSTIEDAESIGNPDENWADFLFALHHCRELASIVRAKHEG